MREPSSKSTFGIVNQLVDWWLDIERIDWERASATVRIPAEQGTVRTKLGLSRTKAPEAFHHHLTVTGVADFSTRHDGDYPFAQPVENVTSSDDGGDICIRLGFGSTLCFRLVSPDAATLTLTETKSDTP